MPSTLLFALNSEGRVFGLSTNGTKWREFIYLGLEFKHLSAIPNFLWAVGGDRQIYVHAHGLDIPIRVKEESFENERWTPFDGFSKRLLPTDRYNFSNQDGTLDRSLNKIRLPSMAWQWEGEWKLELTLDGQPLDPDGWTYAVDFPASYYPTKQWTSCVRRRKWVRYRRYIALNSWCAISPLHKDPTKEPFISIAVGGNYLPGGKDGTILVWAVTAFGRVMFRSDVSNNCPEGQRWNSVTVPPNCEVSQIAVSSTGLVWAVLRNGKALVRIGITRKCVIGDNWVEVEGPQDSLMLQQISIGYNGLWAVTKDYRVWFRKGIDGKNSGISETLAKGTGWVEMCGYMSNVSVASNDQVWGVGAEDKILYFRTSVTEEDLMGKTWRALGAPTQLSRTNSSTSLSFDDRGDVRKSKRHRSWASLNRQSVNQEIQSVVDLDLTESCHSAPVTAIGGQWGNSTDSASEKSTFIKAHGFLTSKDTIQLNDFNSFSSCSSYNELLNNGKRDNAGEKINCDEEYCKKNDGGNNLKSTLENQHILSVGSFHNRGFNEIAIPTRSWSPQHAGGTVVAAEAHYAADSVVFDADEQLGVYSEHGEREDDDDHLYWADIEAFWLTVEAGACLVNVNHLPNWFVASNSNKKTELSKPWRVDILNGLRSLHRDSLKEHQNYEKAFENSSWVKSGRCKCLMSDETNFRDCVIELEWISNESDGVEYGTLNLFSASKDEIWSQINMRKVTAVMRCSVPKNPRLALYYGATSLKLQFAFEDELEEWKSELSNVCCRIRNVSSAPNLHSVWITAATGDIFECDLSYLSKEQRSLTSDAHSLEKTFSVNDMPVEFPLQAGFSPGTSLIMWGCIPDGAKKFIIDFVCKKENGSADIAYHFNPRFDEGVLVQNSRRKLVWGQEKRLLLPFQVGTLFELKIICKTDSFVVFVDGIQITEFSIEQDILNDEQVARHFITHLNCFGDVCITKIRYSSNEVIVEPQSMFWRQIEGHLKKVETAGGITWGIGYDNTVWLYRGTESCSEVACPMHDTRFYYVYENQRWNPLTGYTSHGLPTDRFMWSDVTGKHKRTRENTMLLSKKWRWVNDWSIDFHTPGGVDSEGWQYAVDFPSSYHGTKSLTDCVRRRRWFRCAKWESVGPWTELGYTRLADCSLFSDGDLITAWAVSSDGCVLFRKGVSKICPAGLSWEHVFTDEKVISISCGSNQVWGVSKSGTAICRIGISKSNEMGDSWEIVEAPAKTTLKQVAVGEKGVWALDTKGGISIRLGVSKVLPFGSSWQSMPLFFDERIDPDERKLTGTSRASSTVGFRQISAKSKFWGITNSGRLAYRVGVKQEAPSGVLWLFGIQANFLHASG